MLHNSKLCIIHVHVTLDTGTTTRSTLFSTSISPCLRSPGSIACLDRCPHLSSTMQNQVYAVGWLYRAIAHIHRQRWPACLPSFTRLPVGLQPPFSPLPVFGAMIHPYGRRCVTYFRCRCKVLLVAQPCGFYRRPLWPSIATQWRGNRCQFTAFSLINAAIFTTFGSCESYTVARNLRPTPSGARGVG